MSQRISLNAQDFQILVRDEIVRLDFLPACCIDPAEAEFEIALVDVSDKQKLQSIADAMNLESPLRLEEDTEEIRRWIHGVNQAGPHTVGGFLDAFAATVCRADSCNYPFMRPALLVLMHKYPQYNFTGAL